MQYYDDPPKKKTDKEWMDIFNALRPHQKGGYYYSVTTSTRRSGQMRVSESKYQKLLKKFGKQ